MNFLLKKIQVSLKNKPVAQQTTVHILKEILDSIALLLKHCSPNIPLITLVSPNEQLLLCYLFYHEIICARHVLLQLTVFFGRPITAIPPKRN